MMKASKEPANLRIGPTIIYPQWWNSPQTLAPRSSHDTNDNHSGAALALAVALALALDDDDGAHSRANSWWLQLFRTLCPAAT